jgi:endonuclease/exonuclease/phosphatase (EEP) superfamily protein YafD
MITFLALLFFGFTVLGFFRLHWWMNVMDFPRLQYAAVSFVVGCFALAFGNTPALIICGVTIALNLWRIRRYIPGWSLIRRDDKPHEKHVMSVNSYKENESPEKLCAAILDFDPDVLLVMEMTDSTQEALEDCLKNYPHKMTTPVRDGFRICLFSKDELKNQNITYHGPNQTPLLTAETIVQGREFQVFSAHPKPMLNKQWHEERLAYFRETAAIIARSEKPVMVLGDFNAVPWEWAFRGFLERAGLENTLYKQGYLVTWPVFFPLMGIPMDHILISDGEDYGDLKVGPFVGSDHYPISLNLKP